MDVCRGFRARQGIITPAGGEYEEDKGNTRKLNEGEEMILKVL